MSVRFEIGGVLDKIEAMRKRAVFAVTNEARTDLNEYVPFETGDLMGSSLRHSVIEDGHIEWVTPYAAIVWRGTRKGRPLRINKVEHKKATSRWTVKGKADNLEKWRRKAEKALGGHT